MSLSSYWTLFNSHYYLQLTALCKIDEYIYNHYIFSASLVSSTPPYPTQMQSFFRLWTLHEPFGQSTSSHGKVRIPLAVLPVSVAGNLLPIFVTFPNLFVPRCTESGVNYPVIRRLNITYGGRPCARLCLPSHFRVSVCLGARQLCLGRALFIFIVVALVEDEGSETS